MRGLKADLGMLTVAEWLRCRSAAATEENSVLSVNVVEIAVPIAQLKLAQISGQEIRAVLCRNNLYHHEILQALRRVLTAFHRFRATPSHPIGTIRQDGGQRIWNYE